MKKWCWLLLCVGLVIVLSACGNKKEKEMDELHDFFETNRDLNREIEGYFNDYFRLAEEKKPEEAKEAIENLLTNLDVLIGEYAALDFTYEPLMEYVSYLRKSSEYSREKEILVLDNFNSLEQSLKEEGEKTYELAHPVDDIVRLREKKE